CQWERSGQVLKESMLAKKSIDFSGHIGRGSLHVAGREWTLKCHGAMVPLADARSAQLIIFAGHDFTRFILTSNGRIIRAAIDAFSVSTVGHFQLSVVQSRGETRNEGNYLAKRMRLVVSRSKCSVGIDPGNAAVIDGEEIKVVECEQRS